MIEKEESPTVLVVDDTPENIDVLKGLLQDQYRVKVALNGPKAIKIAQSDSPPDIILLDIMMPEMNGFEVCSVLKSDEKTKEIPIIFITAKNEIEDETKGFDLGAVDFIAKPISPPIVKSRVRAQLEFKKANDRFKNLPKQLGKYLSPQVVDAIVAGKSEAKINTSRKKLTIFFSDLSGFTATSESMEPEDLTFCINTYLDKMAEIAIEFGGTLDKFMGDGIMIFFGDPESKGVKEDAVACVAMAKRMQEAIAELQAVFAAQGIDKDLQARIGIHTGYCNVGNFGSERRMDYTLLGRSVNLASRLESSGIVNAIQISNETHVLIKDVYPCTPRDEKIKVKGFDHPIQTFIID